MPDDPGVRAAMARVADALYGDQGRLRDAVDDLAARGGGDRDVQAFVAIADRVLTTDFTGAGECQEEDPFAPAYIVMVGRRAYWRCQHDPSHDLPA